MSASSKSRLPILLLVSACLFGLAARYVLLGSVPPKLWYDEAWFVNTARDVLELRTFPIYFDNFGAGVHPLHVYLTAAMALLVGITPLTGRLVTALSGALTIPLTYLACRDLLGRLLPENQKRTFAAIAALLQAGLFWNIMLSRLGTEIIHVQLFAIPAFHLFWIGLQRGRVRWFVASGAIIGAAQYISPNARFLPITAILISLGMILLHPTQRKRTLSGLLLAGLAAMLVFAPLGLHFLQNPADFWGRAATVTAGTFGGDNLPLALLRNLGNTLLGISIRGDTMIRHNLPGRPNFDPLLSIFFWIGVVVLAKRSRQDSGALLILGWAIGLTLTTVFSDGAPIFTRSLGAAPAMVMIVAAGLFAAHAWLQQHVRPRLAGAVLAIAIAVSLFWNAFDYFVRFANHPDTFDGFTAGEYEIAAAARRLAETDAVYLSPWNSDSDAQNHRLLLRDTTVRGFNTVQCQMYFPERTNHFLVETINDYHGTARLKGRFPFGSVTETLEHYPRTEVFTVPPDNKVEMAIPIQADFGADIALVGASVWPSAATRGETLSVTLAWRARAALEADLIALVHIATDAIAVPVVGHDSVPCSGTYPTSAWRAGEVVFDSHDIQLPKELTAGTYRIYVGLYSWPELVRLPPKAGGTPDGRLEIRSFNIGAE